jgi:hypothetical protein
MQQDRIRREPSVSFVAGVSNVPDLAKLVFRNHARSSTTDFKEILGKGLCVLSWVRFWGFRRSIPSCRAQM